MNHRVVERHLSPARSRGQLHESLPGKEKFLYLGNLDAKRDWGFAPSMWIACGGSSSRKQPDDFVIGTGETHSVREFVHEAFAYAGLDVEEHVRIDQKYFRPTEVDVLIANPKKSEKVLGWKPSIKFKDLVKIMVDADMKAAGLEPIGESDKIIRLNFQNGGGTRINSR